jgi:hypothetical protein
MRFFLSAIAIAIGFLFTPGASAQIDGDKVVFLRVSDSLKDTEAHIAKLLLEKMNVNSSLQVRGDNTEDLVLRVRINENTEQNLPTVAAVIDTRILNRDKDKKVISQLINIASFADIKIKQDKKFEILEWTELSRHDTFSTRTMHHLPRMLSQAHLQASSVHGEHFSPT